ncbi:hypothetical protein C0991_000287 [Blastosporella zonata]|nr:hypothetical protein C0991_000287 [Blastosporella zonata]
MDDDIEYIGTRAPTNFPTGIILDVEKSSDVDPACTLTFRRSSSSSVVHIGRRPSHDDKIQSETDAAMFRCAVVSRKHAKIAFSDSGHVYLIDMNSHHGTHIRKPYEPSSRMINPESPTRLFDGDVVTFGKSVGRNNEYVRPVVAHIQLIYDRPSIDLTKIPTISSSGRFSVYSSSSDSDIEELSSIPASGPNALPLAPRTRPVPSNTTSIGRAIQVFKRLLPPAHPVVVYTPSTSSPDSLAVNVPHSPSPRSEAYPRSPLNQERDRSTSPMDLASPSPVIPILSIPDEHPPEDPSIIGAYPKSPNQSQSAPNTSFPASLAPPVFGEAQPFSLQRSLSHGAMSIGSICSDPIEAEHQAQQQEQDSPDNQEQEQEQEQEQSQSQQEEDTNTSSPGSSYQPLFHPLGLGRRFTYPHINIMASRISQSPDNTNARSPSPDSLASTPEPPARLRPRPLPTSQLPAHQGTTEVMRRRVGAGGGMALDEMEIAQDMDMMRAREHEAEDNDIRWDTGPVTIHDRDFGWGTLSWDSEPAQNQDSSWGAATRDSMAVGDFLAQLRGERVEHDTALLTPRARRPEVSTTSHQPAPSNQAQPEDPALMREEEHPEDYERGLVKDSAERAQMAGEVQSLEVEEEEEEYKEEEEEEEEEEDEEMSDVDGEEKTKEQEVKEAQRQKQIQELEGSVRELQDEINVLQTHRRNYKARFNSNVQRISSKLSSLSGRLDALEVLKGEVGVLARGLGALRMTVANNQNKGVESEEEGDCDDSNREDGDEDIEESEGEDEMDNEEDDDEATAETDASLKTLRALVDDVEPQQQVTPPTSPSTAKAYIDFEQRRARVRENWQEQEQEAQVRIDIAPPGCNIRGSEREVQTSIFIPCTPTASASASTPSLLKRKRSVDEEQEADSDADADAMMVPAARPTKRARTRMQHIASVTVQTATAVTVGAIATWSALAFS